jgi:Pyruvate/2-oxoacid:ferredoxin oxidoreductase delta subunit/bacterioferritin-associated ferredoxin
MKVVEFLSVVDENICTGDKLCQRICPSGAIKVLNKKAVVDDKLCVACLKCVDVCTRKAVHMERRDVQLMLAVDAVSQDEGKIAEICFNARLLPNVLVCACTGTEAQEVAAAILQGAKTPEDIICMTGCGSGCGIYCMGLVFRLFEAAGITISKDHRWNPVQISLWDIPESVIQKYPQYFMDEDMNALTGQK